MWVYVGEAIARQYRYHGIAGWLAVFLVLMTSGTLWGAGEEGYKLATKSALLLKLGGVGLAVLLTVALQFVINLWGLLVALQGWHRHPTFPRRAVMVVIAYIVAGALQMAIVMAVAESGSPLVQGAGLALVAIVCFGTMLIWYLRASKRVHATFRSELRRNDPLAADLLLQAQPQDVPALSSGSALRPQSASGR